MSTYIHLIPLKGACMKVQTLFSTNPGRNLPCHTHTHLSQAKGCTEPQIENALALRTRYGSFVLYIRKSVEAVMSVPVCVIGVNLVVNDCCTCRCPLHM